MPKSPGAKESKSIIPKTPTAPRMQNVRITDMVANAMTTFPEGYAALTAIPADSYHFENLPTVSHDGETEHLDLVYVGSCHNERNYSKIWAHASSQNVTFYQQFLKSPAGTPLSIFPWVANLQVRFTFPFCKIRPHNKSDNHQRLLCRYRKMLLVAYSFMVRGKLDVITHGVLDNAAPGTVNEFADGNTRYGPAEQFGKLCSDFLREKDKEDGKFPPLAWDTTWAATKKSQGVSQATPTSTPTPVKTNNKVQGPSPTTKATPEGRKSPESAQAKDSPNSSICSGYASAVDVVEKGTSVTPTIRKGDPLENDNVKRAKKDQCSKQDQSYKVNSNPALKQAPQAPVPQASAPQALAPSGLTTPPLSPFDTPSLTILLHRTADRLHTAYKDIEAELAKENAQNADLKQRVALLDEQVNAQQLDVELELHGAKEKIKYCQKRRAERVEELTLEIREWKERAEAAEREVEVLREKAGKWDALAADLAGEGVEGCGGE